MPDLIRRANSLLGHLEPGSFSQLWLFAFTLLQFFGWRAAVERYGQHDRVVWQCRLGLGAAFTSPVGMACHFDRGVRRTAVTDRTRRAGFRYRLWSPCWSLGLPSTGKTDGWQLRAVPGFLRPNARLRRQNGWGGPKASCKNTATWIGRQNTEILSC